MTEGEKRFDVVSHALDARRRLASGDDSIAPIEAFELAGKIIAAFRAEGFAEYIRFKQNKVRAETDMKPKPLLLVNPGITANNELLLERKRAKGLIDKGGGKRYMGHRYQQKSWLLLYNYIKGKMLD